MSDTQPCRYCGDHAMAGNLLCRRCLAGVDVEIPVLLKDIRDELRAIRSKMGCSGRSASEELARQELKEGSDWGW